MTEKTIKEILADTTKSDVPVLTEKFSDFIIEEALAGQKLAGVVSATEQDTSKGDSDTIKVPYFPTASIESVNEHASATASTFSANEVSVSLSRYSEIIFPSVESIYHCNYDLVEQILNALSRGWANKKDELITVALNLDGTTKSGFSSTPLAEISCADYTSTPVNLYNALGDARKTLRSNDLDPDTIVISPEAEAELLNLISDTNNSYQITADEGSIGSVFGMNAIVSSYVVDWSTADSNDAVAAVLDSDVGLAEAHGKETQFVEKDAPEEAAVKEIFNAWYGVSPIDDGTNSLLGIVYHA